MAIDGISSANAAQQLQIAQQNQQSAVKKTEGTATTDVASALSKLNSMYASTGENKATTALDSLAKLMGTDTDTLTSSPSEESAAKVASLLSQQLELKTLSGGSDKSDSKSSLFETGSTASASGNLFDTSL